VEREIFISGGLPAAGGSLIKQIERTSAEKSGG
jgi:hypothetical protein